ncbi:MAG TPA: hypothetical protein VGE97_11110 [Nitrososphaera sp.]
MPAGLTNSRDLSPVCVMDMPSWHRLPSSIRHARTAVNELHMSVQDVDSAIRATGRLNGHRHSFA